MYCKGNLRRFIVFWSLLFLFCSLKAFSQIRAGASFLKIGHGVRISSMGLTSGGELRDNYVIFTNPGAAGFLREWHWSATYEKWIAEVYHASIMFNKRVRMPWSSQTRFSVSAIYQGVPGFDSSDKSAPVAEASDLLLSITMGQPITFLSNNLSIGFNFKYLKSKLDSYTANSLIWDVGMMARTSKFSLKNSLLKYGVFSAGIALTQNGKELKFDRFDTPLPRTFRTGISFYAGTHDGFQIQLSGDYFSIKDEKGHFGVGAALNFSNIFALNLGYNFNNDLMDKFSIGGTFQLDDYSMPEKSFFPGKNKAARVEIATLNEGEFFSRTYQGGFHYLPNCPEGFRRIFPAMNDTIKTETVSFSWEKTRDPDLFDSVEYNLIVGKSKKYLEDLIALSKNSPDLFLKRINGNDSLLVAARANLDKPGFEIPTPGFGHYFWAVFATDENYHVRVSKTGGEEIGRFFVPETDLEIRDIQFKYHPWITEDDYQGTLELTIANNGTAIAKNFVLLCFDSTIVKTHVLPADSLSKENRILLADTIDVLPAKSVKTVSIPWHTPFLGKHKISAFVDKDRHLQERNRENNQLFREFITIPKGAVSLPDTINSLKECVTRLTMPLITRIFFDKNDTRVHDEYLFPNGTDPYLAILAQRLIDHPEMKISLRGVADPNSEKATKKLADGRANAVKDSLIRIGVSSEQIKLLPGKVLAKRRVPANAEDARMVFEDRRYVEIFTNENNQRILFEPIEHQFTEYSIEPLPIQIKIFMAIPAIDGKFHFSNDSFSDSLKIDSANDLIQNDLQWGLPDLVVKSLVDKSSQYEFVLIDAEGRRFKTHKKESYFIRGQMERHHRIVMPMKFAETAPIYSFYWDFCFDALDKAMNQGDWRFRFSGHGCAIGSDAVNLRLSRQRVQNFNRKFRQFLKKNYPESQAEILKRWDKPQGYGEKKPLIFKYATGEIQLFGDNDKACGRILNRRIELELYRIE